MRGFRDFKNLTYCSPQRSENGLPAAVQVLQWNRVTSKPARGYDGKSLPRLTASQVSISCASNFILARMCPSAWAPSTSRSGGDGERAASGGGGGPAGGPARLLAAARWKGGSAHAHGIGVIRDANAGSASRVVH